MNIKYKAKYKYGGFLARKSKIGPMLPVIVAAEGMKKPNVANTKKFKFKKRFVIPAIRNIYCTISVQGMSQHLTCETKKGQVEYWHIPVFYIQATDCSGSTTGSLDVYIHKCKVMTKKASAIWHPYLEVDIPMKFKDSLTGKTTVYGITMKYDTRSNKVMA